MKTLASSFLVLVAALGLSACHVDKPDSPDAKVTDVAPPEYPVGEYPARTVIRTSYSMYWADTIRTACSGPSPFFEFDSDAIDKDGKSTMYNLAECMKSGALRDKRIRLIGRTDPRGTEEYNEKLGLERAEVVKRYLYEQHQIPLHKINVISYGEDKPIAPNKTKAGKAKNRRIEFRLID